LSNSQNKSCHFFHKHDYQKFLNTVNELIKNNVILQQCIVMWMEILLLLRILTVLSSIWAWNRAGLVEDLWRNSLPVICDGNDKLQLFTRIHCQWPMRLETGHKRAMNRTVEDVAVLSRFPELGILSILNSRKILLL